MKDTSNIVKFISLKTLIIVILSGVLFSACSANATDPASATLTPSDPTASDPPVTASVPASTSSLDPDPTLDDDPSVTPSPTIQPSPNICDRLWGLPSPATPPAWLSTPSSVEGLATNVKYVYLAGELITHGFVNAADCPDGGLSQDGVSNTCGMEKAFSQVVAWQNQFDQDILTAALENQIPAQLLKRLFAQETQFWPPTDFAPPAYGIGNVTSPGIEPLFMWYYDVYQDTCQELFSYPCSQAYSSLTLADQQKLRGFFISQKIHAYCSTCSNGIDLDKTKQSIDYFAKLVVANCHQVDLNLWNFGIPPESIPYEDAWRLTITNYTVGTGCVMNGLEHLDRTQDFSWDSFTSTIDPDCDVNLYLNKITR
jgi:hypothetical protein